LPALIKEKAAKAVGVLANGAEKAIKVVYGSR
jgi:hypothetical protein